MNEQMVALILKLKTAEVIPEDLQGDADDLSQKASSYKKNENESKQEIIRSDSEETNGHESEDTANKKKRER